MLNNIFKFRKRAQRNSPWSQRKTGTWLLSSILSRLIAVFVVASLFLANVYLWKEPALYLWNMTGIDLKVGEVADIFHKAKNSSSDTTSISFSMCGGGNWNNCVVDGDTFYLNGQPIRIADIDTPETHPSRCAYEADLGARATRRLYDLLNAGPFEMESLLTRDVDKYGRKLRIITRNGQSLGDILVSEGLAREWTGHRMPWCN